MVFLPAFGFGVTSQDTIEVTLATMAGLARNHTVLISQRQAASEKWQANPSIPFHRPALKS
jgi:hypothetical protein